MEDHVWAVILLLFTTIVGLIGVVWKMLIGRIADLSKTSKDGLEANKKASEQATRDALLLTEKGLSLKVGAAEYKIVREWQQDMFEGMKVSIRELKDENNVQHQAIMVEIRKNNT